MRSIVPTFLFLATLSSAGAETRPSIPSLSSRAEDDRTEILVLAGPHTESLGDGLSAEHFSTLLAVLDTWGPDAIALERLPGREVVAMKTDPTFAPVIEQFLGGAEEIAAVAQTRTGLSAVDASKDMLAWSGAPDTLPQEETALRLLTALAAYEVETALLHWRHLRDPDTVAALPESVRNYLAGRNDRLNERVAVGVTLAARRGHSRLWSVDSHADKDLFLSLVDDLTAGLEASEEAKAVGDGAPYKQAGALQRRALEDGDLLPLYAFMNSVPFVKDDVRAQFDLFNRVAFPHDAGRSRLAAWDERNLRIAANVRRVSAHVPGGRVLVVIGAGHKPFLDALLAASLDVRVVQLDELLATTTR